MYSITLYKQVFDVQSNIHQRFNYSMMREDISNQHFCTMHKLIVDTYTILIDLFYSYQSSFIDKTFRKFFSGYISSLEFLSFLDNERHFLQMRIALSGQPSRQQSQVKMRSATLTTDNYHLIEESHKKQEFTIQENTKPNEFQNKLIIHYTHEDRFNKCKRDMHCIFQEIFSNTQIIETKLIVGNRKQKSTMRELIRKRARQTILKNKARANENQEMNRHRRLKAQNQTINNQT
ncbi:unnamed protein product [Rotaria magnacalcarata]|uniref:Uncharacterized protein n=2 Tax=Rotaria magnacalcarata TaxID=392030 RepID=A0A816T4H0_9BILA|nr:unnamed protein product [Rotaria magnacalcarata]CAF2109121.1 unnamed protein product [Rotaria magnacalcarata]